jgi:hypothetical protein
MEQQGGYSLSFGEVVLTDCALLAAELVKQPCAHCAREANEADELASKRRDHILKRVR